MNEAPRLFGSPQRTEILLALALLRESYPTELARATGVALFTAQRVLNDLEREGVLVSRSIGRNRIFSLNKQMYGMSEFEAFLRKYALRSDVGNKLATLRRRPRRRGKPI